MLFTDVPSSFNIRAICSTLKNGRKSVAELEESLKIERNGNLNKRLGLLLDMDLIKKNFPINKINNNKRAKYELKDNAIRFYYTFIANNRSLLDVIGEERFYEIIIEKYLNQYISHRFEELVRDYFSIEVKNGNYRDVINVGTYYYDDIKNKTNGEFDVALMHLDNKVTIVEVKYFKEGHLLSDGEMNEEFHQVKQIDELNIKDVAFVSTSGFDNNQKYKTILADELYK